MTKPFNPALPCTTRDGRPVRILCTDAKGRLPICALIMNPDGQELDRRYSAGGSFFAGEPLHHDDLINVPTKRKGWIGVQPTGGESVIATTTNMYASKDYLTVPGDGWQYIEIEFDE